MTSPRPVLLAATLGLAISVHAQKPLFSSSQVHDRPVTVKADLTGAKELWLVVSDGGDGFGADWADWMEPVLVMADGSKVKLTELKPKVAKVGFGELGVGKNAGGQPLKVNGREIAFGFGAHAPSVIGFDLPDGVTGFEAQGGVDDGGLAQNSGGTVRFQVFTKKPGEPTAGGVGYGPDDALANMQTFTTPAGLGASHFAAEPMVLNPTNIDIDPRGRVWAVECVNYRGHLSLREAGDRVVILESTQSGGPANKATTFYQSKELTNPLGICVLPQETGTKVIVSAAPNVWLLTDSDGDDKADEAKILFKVGGEWNYDHQVHSFSFGPDGKFYFNGGNSVTELMWPDGKVVTDLAGNEVRGDGKPYRQGMVFRCDIDLNAGVASNVEVLAHNFRNNYEVGVDSFGTMWQSDNDDDGNQGVRINYVMDGGNFGFTDELTGAGWQSERTNLEPEIPRRHWHLNDPGVVPNLLQTGAGSPTGIVVNEGTGLGTAFANQIIHCEPGQHTVRAYPVEKDGAGYTATMVDILTGSDPWYRASDNAIAPDGSLFVADWYDPGVGGHAMGDHDLETMRGRVYRVAQDGAKYDISPPHPTTPAGFAETLCSPNKPTQYVAWSALHDMGVKAEPALLGLWKSENPRFRARALGLLTQIKGRETKYLVAGLGDPDSDVRCFALRLMRMMRISRGFDPAAIESSPTFTAKILHDSSAAVRREIALSLAGRNGTEQLWAALAQQHDDKDRWYLEALGIGARGNEDACFDTWLAAVGDLWNTPAGRDIVWRSRATQTAVYLTKILSDPAIPAADKPRYLRALDFLPASETKTKALVALSGNGDGVVSAEALARLKDLNPDTNPEVKAAIEQQLAGSRGTPRFIALVRNFNLQGQAPALLAAALKNPQDPLANEALKLVFADSESTKLISAALAGPQATTMMAMLGSSSDRRATAMLVEAAISANPAAARIEAVKSLARSESGAVELVRLAKDGKLPEDLKPAATTALYLVQYPSLEADIAALFPAPSALGGKPLPAISELVKLTGDPVNGRAIFALPESSCIICHRVDDTGVDFGPALSEIGSKLTKEGLFDAIINPNAGLSMGFETIQLTMKDGSSGMGIVRSETADDLVLGMPGGATVSFPKNQIVGRTKLTTSMMPSGMNQMLSQQDLIDLVEYLSSRKKP
jgi:putative membrane-bound dehydrogenase-like protein